MKWSLISCAPQGQPLSEEMAESQGRQRRASPHPWQGARDRVWAFIYPPHITGTSPKAKVGAIE